MIYSNPTKEQRGRPILVDDESAILVNGRSTARVKLGVFEEDRKEDVVDPDELAFDLTDVEADELLTALLRWKAMRKPDGLLEARMLFAETVLWATAEELS